MNDITAEALAEGFNTASPRQKWRARVVQKGGPQVWFDDGTSMVTLIYRVEDGRFYVQFRKTVGCFGDYINAIARAFACVLSALQAAGLPFKAPQGVEGIDILVKSNGAGERVTVSVAN